MTQVSVVVFRHHGRLGVNQRRTTPASVYDVLMDLDRWSDFMPGVSAASWEVRGAPGTGVGGIRRMRLGLGVTRDRIVGGTRPHHHAYVATLPWYQQMLLKDYRGDIRIEDRPNGSLIVWTASCTPRVPGLRNLNQTLEKTYARLAAALAQEAERPAIR
jgi:Polyketide cyclase / dehydrase and lipid transport